MATSFQLGDLTIHRVIEEESPLFDPLTFLGATIRRRKKD